MLLILQRAVFCPCSWFSFRVLNSYVNLFIDAINLNLGISTPVEMLLLCIGRIISSALNLSLMIAKEVKIVNQSCGNQLL